MSIYKDNRKTKDGRCYFFQVMKNGELYKSKRFLTREEARKEEAKFLLSFNPVKKRKVIKTSQITGMCLEISGLYLLLKLQEKNTNGF